MSQRQRDPDDGPIRLDSVVARHLPRPRPELELPVLPDRVDRLLGAFEAMGACVSEFDSEGRITYASPNVESIFGFTPEAYLASGVEFHPDDLPEVVRLGSEVRATGGPASNESRVRHKQGHWVWVQTTLLAWHASPDAEFRTIGITRDITELKRAEEARREGEARYWVIAQASCDLISELDADGRPTYVGPNAEEILGYTPDEALALEPWSLIHPDDEQRVRDRLASEFLEEDAGELELEPNHRRQRMFEFRLRHRDGHWVWLETLGLTYRRADGQRRYLAVSRDVTERRRAEQERREFEEGLQRAQKLESLGVLAGGIAHDFNNLLTPILGEAGLGLSDLPEDSPVRDRLQKIQKAARRAAALTGQMLAYAGQQPLRVELLDFSTLVDEMQALVSSSVSGKTTLDIRLERGLPPVEGEAAQLSQVVMNLVTNALESLVDGAGRITVRTGVVKIETPPAGLLFAETLGSGPHVYFEVADSGAGMDDATRARIFDPFYTTRFAGRGLGLAAVAGIVRAHRGAIEVESEPGRGTRFRVLLPAAGGATPRPSPKAPAIGSWRETGAALVIDDDEGVRELAEDVLRRTGMKVLTAADGHEGVKLFRLHSDSIRVILLDRTMPALSGADTLQAIRAVRPEARIVLVSGYSEERVTRELAGLGVAGFLKKPFTPEDLLARVREALETPAAG